MRGPNNPTDVQDQIFSLEESPPDDNNNLHLLDNPEFCPNGAPLDKKRALHPSLMSFDLKANSTIIVHQIKHASVIQVAGDYYIMMYSHYYPKIAPDVSSRTITHNYTADPSSKKSVLVAAKINPDCKGAIITYEFSIEAKGEQVLDVASLSLSTSASQPREPDMACYLACMEHIPQGSTTPTVALQLYNSTAKKSRILFTSKSVVHRTKSYFQLLELNDGTYLMVLFLKSMTELEVVIAPSNYNTFHEYFSSAPILSLPRSLGNMNIKDFQLDSQTETDSLIAQKSSTFGAVISIVLLVEEELPDGQPREPSSDDGWSNSTIHLGELRVNNLNEWKYGPRIHIECSRIKILEEAKKHSGLNFTDKIESVRVRLCSKLNRVFIFAAGTSESHNKIPTKFLLIAQFCPTNPEAYSVHHEFLPQTPLKFSMTEIGLPKTAACGKLMPPVDQKFMIAENPGLRRPTGVMTTGPQKHPLFIVGLQNSDSLKAVYLDEPVGPFDSKRLRVQNAKDYFLKASADHSVVKREYHHVTSISWVKTLHGEKFTMAANRFSVITFGLNSCSATSTK